ncbi:HAD family hydrolase [Paenibacillus sp. IB182496]|uniref:HAD family hydrolase n=1 Tax=Paenibacillus sabuli TaxID=2772509 RepID=A0A927BQD5_9BACL|nr:HAD family hydrolase [Paenibacillus sabuli]MBD2844342.1 HAD family hydrolase [Paenibacillus sabuli]
MTDIRIGDRHFEVELVVFDKDGLLFDAQYFWKCLAQIRIAALREALPSEGVRAWCRRFGVRETGGAVTDVEPGGIFALAPPQEEIIVTAAVLAEWSDADWGVCRERAAELFAVSDRQFDLLQSLQPRPGFPAIFDRLEAAGVPFGIATSDDDDRTRRSIARYARVEALQFVVTPVDVERGKPHPDMLELIARRTGIRPERIMMIGDSFVDVRMARAAGCIGVGIPDHPEMAERMRPWADAMADSLEELEIECTTTTIPKGRDGI